MGLFSFLENIPVLGTVLGLVKDGAWWAVSGPADSLQAGAKALVAFIFGPQ